MQGYSYILHFKNSIMSQAKYLILCANCAHPSGDLKFFLLEDDDGNTVEFEDERAAKNWCADAGSDGALAYTILCTDDFSYE